MEHVRGGGERMRLPVGFAYDGADRVILDPDQQVQQALRVFFETFRRVGSATATVREFRRLKLRFPRRVQHGARKGEILWGEPEHHRARWVLHQPRHRQHRWSEASCPPSLALRVERTILQKAAIVADGCGE